MLSDDYLNIIITFLLYSIFRLQISESKQMNKRKINNSVDWGSQWMRETERERERRVKLALTNLTFKGSPG